MKNLITLTFLLLFISCNNQMSKEQKVEVVEKEPTDLEWTQDQIKASQLSNLGKPIKLGEEELVEDAIADVALFLNGGDGCGSKPGCGKWQYLRNKTKDKKIQVTIKTSWIYQNQQRSETTVHDTSPGQEIHLGCTAWCSSEGRQDFKRKIVGAVYL
jgi:hypothetical protein